MSSSVYLVLLVIAVGAVASKPRLEKRVDIGDLTSILDNNVIPMVKKAILEHKTELLKVSEYVLTYFEGPYKYLSGIVERIMDAVEDGRIQVDMEEDRLVVKVPIIIGGQLDVNYNKEGKVFTHRFNGEIEGELNTNSIMLVLVFDSTSSQLALNLDFLPSGYLNIKVTNDKVHQRIIDYISGLIQNTLEVVETTLKSDGLTSTVVNTAFGYYRMLT